MRIENIKLHNFRQYRDFQFNFTHKEGMNDMHIIYAKNGVGKTNVLNAITWCLYDYEMHLGDKNTASEILNYQQVNEIRQYLQDDGNQLGEVSVEILLSSDDNCEKICFKRIGKFNVTIKNVVRIGNMFTILHFKDGEWNSIESDEDTLAMVKKFLPEEIHDYIFFDGEHLENYFRNSQSEKIKNGIEDLTQARIIEKAELAFNKYLVDNINPIIANSSNSEIASLQKELDKTQSAIDSAKKTITEYSDQIKKCDDSISELENTISGHINLSAKTSRLNELDKLITENNTLIENKKAEIMVFVRKFVQYFALYPSIRNLYNYIKAQDQKGKLPPRIDKFLLNAIKEHKHCLICDQDLGEHSLSFIDNLRKELEVSSETSALLNKTIVSLRQFLNQISNYKELRETLFSEMNELRKKSDKYNEEETKIKKYLSSIPNTDEITQAIENKKDMKNLHDELIKKKGIEEEKKKELEQEYNSLNKDLTSLINKNKQLEKIKLQADYCTKCRNILHNVKEELLNECRREMEKETLNNFLTLLWKKDAFSKVEISDNYTFKLFDVYGTQTLGSCSAAERALLALSFTLALQKVSMHDSLIFIDTPIGRVDEENRLNFINTLCEISKHKQVILTFTPTEYDVNVRNALQERYSTLSELVLENDTTKLK